MKTKSDFSQGSVPKLIIRLGFPMMLAELVNVLYNVVDRMYIGHIEGEGTLALTGLGVCFPLITLIGAFANLYSTGGNTLATIARGEGQTDHAVRIQDTSFTMLLLTGGVLTAALYIFAEPVLRLLGAVDETLPYALNYFRIYVTGTIPVLITLGMNPFINGQGFPKTGMLTVVIGAVMNIALDPLFIFTFGMGVSGAALATVVSQIAGSLWVLSFLRGERAVLRLTKLRVSGAELSGILKLGVTGFTFKVTNSITQAVVNMVLVRWGGALSVLYIGAMSLIGSLRETLSLPNNGVTMAGQSVMSYNYGAKEYGRVSESIRFMFLGGLCVNVIGWALIMLTPETLIRIFTEDDELVRMTVRCAKIYFGAFPFMAMQLTGQSTFVALNRPRYALFFSLLRKIGLVLPLTLLLPGLGPAADGVFWAEMISQLTGATACFVTMYLAVWRKLGKTAA